ncbi:MAG TPA: rhodanese-like domain-containing protein [Gaiellaceae bacterium]|nr:rhodanese-like domain-containing protein [Gaiellaceae bacterium]
MSAEVSAPEAKTLLERGEAIALDVREAYEWAEGHIAGALHVPLGELGQRLHEVPRDRRIVAVCRSGNRSGAVTQALAQAGYDVLNLAGGLISWHRHGLPLEPAPGTVA